MLQNPDSQRCPVIWGAQLGAVEENTFLRLSTFVAADSSGLGPLPVVGMRKEDEVSGLGGRARRVDGICGSIAHTLDSLGACGRCLCVTPRDRSSREYLRVLSRCCASLCEAAFPRGPVTGPLMQEALAVFPALSIRPPPLRAWRSRAHLGRHGDAGWNVESRRIV